MSDYHNPQSIWDRWILVRDTLQPKYDELMSQGKDEAAKPHGRRLEAMWDLTQKDLMLSAIIKYLEVDTSEQTVTEETK